MLRNKTSVLMAGRFCVLAISFIAAQVCVAKDTKKEVPLAPVPTQISTAKTLFIANAGGEDNPSDSQFNGGPDRAYNQFYAEMKSWGRYELVATPADADLLLELRFTQPRVGSDPQAAIKLDAVYDPQFRLVIRDLKTHAVLWGFTEHAQWAILQSNRDKNFDLAMDKLVDDVKNLVSRVAPAADDAKK